MRFLVMMSLITFSVVAQSEVKQMTQSEICEKLGTRLDSYLTAYKMGTFSRDDIYDALDSLSSLTQSYGFLDLPPFLVTRPFPDRPKDEALGVFDKQCKATNLYVIKAG